MTDRDRLKAVFKKIKYKPFQTSSECDFATQFTDYALNCIIDECLANGVIVPPCKVGQTVYCLIQGFDNPLKANVKRIVIQESGVVISCSVLGYFGQSYMATDFGKTVFLTKEEAEEKLKEWGSGNA